MRARGKARISGVRILNPPVFFLTTMLLLGTFCVIVWHGASASSPRTREIVKTEGTPHAPIYINGNGNFTSANGVIAGSGTPEDPYIIEGYSINEESAQFCIWVENSDVHFIIRNCVLKGAEVGIALLNVKNGKIENNSISSRDIDIFLSSSTSNEIRANIVEGNNRGILLSSSINNSVTNNEFKGGLYFGIILEFSSENSVSMNTIGWTWYDSIRAISLSDSNSNTIISNNISCFREGVSIVRGVNNTISKNRISQTTYCGITLGEEANNNTIAYNELGGEDEEEFSIRIENSRNIYIIGNTMRKHGIGIFGTELSHWNSHHISTTNTIDGRPICYYKNQIGGTVSADAGQIIIANCTGFLVKDVNLSSGSIGISVGFSSQITIQNSSISFQRLYGVYTYMSTGTTIRENTIISNGHNALFLVSTSNCNLVRNMLRGNGETGIALIDGFNNTIIENNATNLNHGIYLQGESNDTIASNNLLSINCGICCLGTTSTAITGNNITGSLNTCIILKEGCNFVTIVNNTLTSVSEHGVLLDCSYNASLMNNTMKDSGIIISGYEVSCWDSHEIASTNLVNGRRVFYYKNQDNCTVPPDAGQVIFVNCTGCTVKNANVSNGSIGISVVYSSEISIFNTTASGNKLFGIWLWRSHRNNITGNKLFQNFQEGMRIVDSHMNEINSNHISGDSTTIGLYSSSNNTIACNTLTAKHAPGVYLDSSSYNKVIGNTISNSSSGLASWLSHYNEIHQNNFIGNGYGFSLSVSSHNNITQNNVCGNNLHGIHCWEGNNNSFCRNTITDNSQYGLSVHGLRDSIISGNTISRNLCGIYIDSGRHMEIHGNNISTNVDGIFLGNSPYNLVKEND
ncbi:MAG: NosD domain-containing protein, partial [Thermoplasmata archaeon]